MAYPTVVWSLGGIIILMCLVLVALWHVALVRIGQLRKALDIAARSAADAHKAAQTAEDSANGLAELARLHERRASEFFGIIAGVEKERDLWMRLYRDSSQAAGVAQAWLIRDLGRIIQIGNVYAQRLREKHEKAPPLDVDPQLKQVVEEFAETHVKGHPEIQPTDAMALAQAVDRQAPKP